MKKVLFILLILAFVVPSTVAAAPPPQDPPPPPGPPLRKGPPVPMEVPSALGSFDLSNLGDFDIASPPQVEGMVDMQVLSEKQDKGRELVRSLSDEQRARIGQLLADNALPVPGGVGARVQPMQPALLAGGQADAMRVLVPDLERWQATVSSGLAEILTPEQLQLFQESLPPAPAKLAVVAPQPQTQNDCLYEFAYAEYAQNYAYAAYYYAYLAYQAYGDYISEFLVYKTFTDYLYAYYGYLYAYYAYYYYYDATYAYYAYLYNVVAMVIAYWDYPLAYDLYSIFGIDEWYYIYVYEYNKYVYDYYAAYYGYYCYVD